MSSPNGCDQIIEKLKALKIELGNNLTYRVDTEIENLIYDVESIRDNLICLLNKGIRGIMDEHDLTYYDHYQEEEDLWYHPELRQEEEDD